MRKCYQSRYFQAVWCILDLRGHLSQVLVLIFKRSNKLLRTPMEPYGGVALRYCASNVHYGGYVQGVCLPHYLSYPVY